MKMSSNVRITQKVNVGERLTAVEEFLFHYEPITNDPKFRLLLSMALDEVAGNVGRGETLPPAAINRGLGRSRGRR